MSAGLSMPEASDANNVASSPSATSNPETAFLGSRISEFDVSRPCRDFAALAESWAMALEATRVSAQRSGEKA